MRYAIIENGIVANIAESSGALQSNWIEDDGTAKIGGTHDEFGFHDPVIVPPTILEQIATLESTVTQRRLREAALGTDNGWLADIDAQIAALRAQL
jgi:hypothetical protein